ncbi:MAG TPA: hypothetical protein VM433_15160, partial [Mycobacteriales bacterium]|nr:hypothetical protein [Mycobacteriales bacterium]
MSATPTDDTTPGPQLPTPGEAAGAAFDYAGLALRIAVVIALALVVRWLLHRAISRVIQRAIATPSVPDALRGRFVDSSPAIASERRRQRSETVGSVLRSFASLVVFTV